MEKRNGDIARHIEYLKESYEFFSSKNKHHRDEWVCRHFLAVLGISVGSEELLFPPEDPPDVIFGDAAFEIKEVLEDGRRRHEEIKRDIENLIATGSRESLVKEFTNLEYLTFDAVFAKSVSRLESITDSYAPSAVESLDLLVYINFSNIFVDPTCSITPTIDSDILRRWRSVSAFTGNFGAVISVKPAAPRCLAEHVGHLYAAKENRLIL